MHIDIAGVPDPFVHVTSVTLAFLTSMILIVPFL